MALQDVTPIISDGHWLSCGGMMKIDEITEKVIGACFEVINELGAGFLETVYEKSLLIALRQKGLLAQAQVPIEVQFRDQIVGQYVSDIIVENRVCVELKAVKQLAPEHLAQTINYLRATGLPTALLVNFGSKKLEYRRLNNRIEK